ncbi:hypothetical protein [Thermoleptolyngbya sp. M55_K2018_002]|uniref:hypothetical protein n=1 Tax=Thermoleptolyngbya sp. M55_K2018_002 TaxID=2747808 RepID=UPI0019F6E12E|nr:hypothetical protein [Thermoleptolyngbya sp. M55_K2018_002]HIK42492.1 hypothetical protein [Thermoleptolyngbya sp. M55_K2018_002]
MRDFCWVGRGGGADSVRGDGRFWRSRSRQITLQWAIAQELCYGSAIYDRVSNAAIETCSKPLP